jgi:hypothetical protein
MGAKRALTLRLEKAEVIARLDLQRANIADTWREVSEPLESIDGTVRSFSRYSGSFGIAAALLVSGQFGIVRKAMKLTLLVIPYLISHRNKGVIGLIYSLIKKGVARFF